MKPSRAGKPHCALPEYWQAERWLSGFPVRSLLRAMANLLATIQGHAQATFSIVVITSTTIVTVLRKLARTKEFVLVTRIVVVILAATSSVSVADKPIVRAVMSVLLIMAAPALLASVFRSVQKPASFRPIVPVELRRERAYSLCFSFQACQHDAEPENPEREEQDG
jgi:hypothetical protein